MTSEQVYIIGATGNIGTKVVTDLLAQGVSTTIYVRDVEKSRKLFANSSQLTIVQGDYSDLSAFKSSIQDHTRLFLLIADLDNMPQIKHDLGEIAYQAGVKQIVDLSSRFALMDWRTSYIGEAHRLAEERLYSLALKYNRALVTLRPSCFYTNHNWLINGIKSEGCVTDRHPADLKLEWISTDDIADVATLVLTDPIAAHGNRAYVLISDSVDGATRAAYFSKALGKEILYKQVSPKVLFDSLTKSGTPASLAYDFATVDVTRPTTNAVPILLNRPWESLESWITKNKEHFL